MREVCPALEEGGMRFAVPPYTCWVPPTKQVAADETFQNALMIAVLRFLPSRRRPGPMVDMGTGRSPSSGRPEAGPVGRGGGKLSLPRMMLASGCSHAGRRARRLAAPQISHHPPRG